MIHPETEEEIEAALRKGRDMAIQILHDLKDEEWDNYICMELAATLAGFTYVATKETSGSEAAEECMDQFRNMMQDVIDGIGEKLDR